MLITQIEKKKLYIGGQWIDTKEYQSLKSPYNQEEIALIPVAEEEVVTNAIEAAERVKDKLKKMPAFERAVILEKIATGFEKRFDEAVEILAKEAAKPLTTAKGEVLRTIQTYKFAAEEAKRIHGETIPLDAAPGGENRLGYTVREPIGVIAAITPFNFPLNLVAHKVGPAIAAGNPVVLKPASQTPLSSLLLAEISEEAGLPAGALNVVTGKGSVIGDVFVNDQRIKMITFTGSPSVGIGIRNKAGLKRVTLELGSNSAVIIDKGVNIEQVIPRCVTGAFSYQGQVCISLQRIYVHQSAYDEFVKKFVDKANELIIGNPLDLDTDLSALISPSELRRAESWTNEAVKNGAEIKLGGQINKSIFPPTVLVDVDSKEKVSSQEVFAPIVVINKISSVDDGIKYVNDSNYGLQAGIYTDNVRTALKAADQLEVGGVLINDIPTYRVDHMPYGGMKQSGMGREGIKYAIEEMTEMKLVIFNQNN